MVGSALYFITPKKAEMFFLAVISPPSGTIIGGVCVLIAWEADWIGAALGATLGAALGAALAPVFFGDIACTNG